MNKHGVIGNGILTLCCYIMHVASFLKVGGGVTHLGQAKTKGYFSKP